MQLDHQAFDSLNIELAKKHKVYPLRKENFGLVVATHRPWDVEFLQQLECICNTQIFFSVATRDAIQERLTYAESKIDQLTGLTEGFLLTDGISNPSALLDSEDEENAGPIVRFINTTIKTALNRRASDIHIECYEKAVTVKYRIDGHLYPATEALDVRHHSAFISRLKVMSDLDIAEKRTPQDGRFKLIFSHREIDFRISVLPGIHGENVVIRILDSGNINTNLEGLSLDSLGLTSAQLHQFKRIICEPYGMVLITGPTGSGKTTTLYSALKETNTGGEKIITIAVNNKKGLTFAKGLRAILRHDPDKILVGEIRDAETADIAVQSALTGHLVFSSVHANNAIDVMARLSNMGVNLHSALSALNAVLAQRLVRVLCESCKKQSYDIPKEILELTGIYDLKIDSIFQAKGCEYCSGTGYTGRTVISELLIIDETLRTKILDGEKVFESFSDYGFVNGESLRRAALLKCALGVTPFDEVNRATFA